MTPRILITLAALGICLLFGAINPAQAQAAPAAAAEEARTAELRAWFEAQSPQRQELLKRRLRVIKRLPKDKQADLLKAVSEGRPLLNEKQRENLERVRKMPYLERVRLYTVSRELEMARKSNPVAYKRALEAPNRDRALSDMLAVHRAQMLLSPEERERVKTMRPEERMRFVRERMEVNGRERLERISFLDPRIVELRKAAQAGDEAARAELRQAMADLGTLDMLLQRLEPARQQKAMEELRGLGLEKAVDLVRRELKAQWNEQERKRPERDRPGPEGALRPADHRALPPRDPRQK